MNKSVGSKKIKNIGTSIDKISICLNNRTLSDILNEVINAMNNTGSGTKKIELKKFIEFSEKGKKVKLRLSDYIKRLEWEPPKAKINKNGNLKILKLLKKEKFVPKDILNKIEVDFADYNLYQCIEIKPCIQEQGRKEFHDGLKDSEKEIKSNIFWTFDIAKYRKLSGESKVNLFEYAIWVIKIILFLDLKQVLTSGIEENPNIKYLIEKVDERINASIVTGMVLSDTLHLKGYYFEDYYYELAQLNFKSKDSIIADCSNKQSLTFIFKELKNYPTIYSVGKQIELKKKREEKLNMTKAEYELGQMLNAILSSDNDDLIDMDVEEAREINPSAEQEYGVDLQKHYKYVNDIEPTLKDIEEFWATNNRHKEKIKFKIAFQKASNSKEAKVIFRISGTQHVGNLLFSEEDENNKKPTVNILRCFAKADILQAFFNQCLLTFFNNMDGTKNEFENITKSPFSLDVKFIKNNIDGRNYIIAKAILSILASKNNTVKKEIMNKLNSSSREGLRILIKKLKKENNRYQNQEKAVSVLYKYYKDAKNA